MMKLYRGDCLKLLRRLPDASVQCCVTSPPYWGLRDYGTATWRGGDAECDHSPHAHQFDAKSNGTGALREKPRQVCKCGARRIDLQLGLETTPEAYVARMVEVFREVRRVLRDDGTLWLNMGDSYSQGVINHGAGPNSQRKGRRRPDPPPARRSDRPKNLVGIPWRLAFALQADGWYLRSDIIWHKPNPMPESVRDRPTKAHEYVFLLSKSERYFWDQEAVREPQTGDLRGRTLKTFPKTVPGDGNGIHSNESWQSSVRSHIEIPGGRNIRSVWTITPKPFKGAHFATFPPALVERCVKAGTSERGACPQCGKAWERVTEREKAAYWPCNGKWAANHLPTKRCKTRSQSGGMPRDLVSTLGFRPACTCPAADPVPCVVLDPFIGSGTTAAVARSLGRDCVGIDLNPKYLTMARQRVKVALCG
jgi:DNA modification methylase